MHTIVGSAVGSKAGGGHVRLHWRRYYPYNAFDAMCSQSGTHILYCLLEYFIALVINQAAAAMGLGGAQLEKTQR